MHLKRKLHVDKSVLTNAEMLPAHLPGIYLELRAREPRGLEFLLFPLPSCHGNPVRWAIGRRSKGRRGEVGCLTQEVMEPQCLPSLLHKGEQGRGAARAAFPGKVGWGHRELRLHAPGSILDLWGPARAPRV